MTAVMLVASPSEGENFRSWLNSGKRLFYQTTIVKPGLGVGGERTPADAKSRLNA
jgi:hypothetical protein